MENEFGQLVKDYLSQERRGKILHGIIMSLNNKSERDLFEEAEKSLQESVSDLLYIEGAGELGELLTYIKPFDYGGKVGLALEVEIKKHTELKLGSIIAFIGLKVRELKAKLKLSEILLSTYNTKFTNWPIGHSREFDCPKCHGSGKIEVYSDLEDSDGYHYEECNNCEGKGKLIVERKVISND